MFWKRLASVLWALHAVVLAQKADDYKVTSLPGVDMASIPFDQYAGHIEVAPETNSNLFFWMVDQVHPTKPKKLIIWLNGGPGCSSMDGLFLENGPYRVNPDLSLSINANGWQDHATIVFLDQPVGTGFSFANSAGFMHNMTQIAEDFTTFLDKFMAVFPYLKEQELYLAGESFAGTYIPYFADRILALNRKEANKYNLKGIAIGNGWISPRHQYEAYYDYSVAHNLLEGQYLDRATKNLNKCRVNLSLESKINDLTCEDILQDIVDSNTHSTDAGKQCINTYDIRLKNETFPGCGLTWPHELVDVNKYLRTQALRKAVHSEKQELLWQECTASVSVALRHDRSLPADLLLPGILKEIKVLLFSGEYDLICNHIGTEYMIGNMTWNGDQGFKDAERLDWYMGDRKVGYYTEERNLSYVLINDGSHMVPYDKPLETLDMINRFIGVDMDGGNSRVGGSGGQHNVTSQQGQDGSDGQHDGTDQQEQNGPGDDSTSDEEGFGGYGQSAGSYGALILLVSLILIGACWYWPRRNKEPASTKFRLGDQDETTELDELVIGENATLFAAEEEDTHQPPPSGASRFAIADSDDGFDDFADWDEEETLASVPKPKKDGKDH